MDADVGHFTKTLLEKRTAAIATATGPAGWAYLPIITWHILCAIVGFGGVMLIGIWGSALSTPRGEAAGVLAQTLEKVSKVAEAFIIAVPVLGIIAVLLSDGAHSFGSPWLSVSILLLLMVFGPGTAWVLAN